LSTKVHIVADLRCRPVARVTTAGQRHDSLDFEAVMGNLVISRTDGPPRRRPDRVLADKAYSSKKIRAHLRRRGIKATIPEPSTTKTGLDGNVFAFYKFRTMSAERDDLGREVPEQQRITRLGQLLRSTSLGRVPWMGFDRVSEPDPDRGDVEGALVDVLAFVVAGGHGPGDPQLVDRPLDDVAPLVGLGVEGRGSAAAAAASGQAGLGSGGFGDGGLDPAPA